MAVSWAVVVVVGLVVGLLVAPHAFSFAAEPTGKVAVVPIAGGIDGPSSSAVQAMLTKARKDPSIEAVVLLSNSPGGGAAASERLYLEVARTAKQMPVVASIDAMAASGAYYGIAPADYIFAKPSSLVGSVGVFTTTPTELQPLDRVIASGPNKLSGGTKRDWQYKVESLRRAFVGAVYENRGDKLSINRSQLSKAGLFTGGAAVSNGMADEIGGLTAALEEAASRAGLSRYNVTTLQPSVTVNFLTRTNYVASDVPNKRLVGVQYFLGDPATSPATANFLMLPESVIAAGLDRAAANRSANATEVAG